jgi:hypothetical protein
MWPQIAFSLLVAATIPAPKGWREQTFPMPLAFAPSLPYEGTEHDRFSPAWADFASEGGFTYVILWDIKRRTLEPAELERALNVYFDGLMEQVTRGRRIVDPGTVTTSSLHPLAPPEGWQEAVSGRVWTWNGFSKGEALALNLEIAHRACGAERTQVFFAISRAERGRPAWKELRDIRADTRC